MKKNRTYFNWSTGKDSALALYTVLQDPKFEVTQLVTSINSHYNRVTMHGVRRELVMQQAQSIGIPLTTLELPQNPSAKTYETIMLHTLETLKTQGCTHTVFGDIFLEDLRLYRENQLQKINITPHFPLWKRNTHDLLKEFIDLGFKAKIICLNANVLDKSFLGRELDYDFIQDLPKHVDPCGENGEFHTFCYEGPVFKTPISFETGEKIYREYPSPKRNGTENQKAAGFWFCDLIPIKK